MTASLAAPGQILREVFAGSGALFADEAARGGIEQESAGGANLDFLLHPASSSHDKTSWRALWLSLGMCGIAGFAVLIAAAALSAANRSLDVSDLMRQKLQQIDASLLDVPTLKKEVEDVAVEQSRERDAYQAQTEVARSTNDETKQFDAEIRQSITSMDEKLTQVVDAEEKREGAISLRLDKLEANQIASTAAAPAPQARAEDPAANKAGDPGAAPHAPPAFRLKRIAGGIATLDGPDGPVSISVGETVPGLGEILRIGKRGRVGFVVTRQRTLRANLSKVASSKVAAVAKVAAAPN